MTTAIATNSFGATTTAKAPDRILPQKAGRKLWAPMLAMAGMGFIAAAALTVARAIEVNDLGGASTIAAYGHFVTAAMFVGFATVFAAISFAIARILGEFRVGGGGVQEAAGSEVRTLNMPPTAKAFLGLMMMAMMLILGAVVGHVIVGAQTASETMTLVDSEQWAVWLEAARRIGVSLYLFAILLGLATIVQVLRFQSIRIREVAQAKS
jgi:hypothetical protein